MKKLLTIALILIVSAWFYGCADDSGSSEDQATVIEETDTGTTEVTEPETGGETEVAEETPEDEPEQPIIETPVDEPPVVVVDTESEVENEPAVEQPTGGDDDWTNPQPANEFSIYTGYIHAGPANVLSDIGIMSVDDDFLMTGYTPGYIADNDGSFLVRGSFTGGYRFFKFFGTAYTEGSGTTVDGISLMMLQPASATEHNVNSATTLRFVLAMKHYDDPLDDYYLDKSGSFLQAKTEIYNFLGFPNATKNFYEYSVLGDSTGDAYLFKFETVVTGNRSGPGIADYIGRFANAIYDDDLDFKAEIMQDMDDLLVHKAWWDLKNEMVSRGFSVDPAPLWLTSSYEYYTDLMVRDNNDEINIIESENTDQTTQQAIDVSTKNTFAYLVEFADIESAQYIATELQGDLSIWSVGICNNGSVDFPCPGTELLNIEELREILLPAPANLAYNGLLGLHSLVSGQFFIVETYDEPTAPSHTSTGTILPSGYFNLASVDGDWDNSVCVNNFALSWCRRGIKWVTTD